MTKLEKLELEDKFEQRATSLSDYLRIMATKADNLALRIEALKEEVEKLESEVEKNGRKENKKERNET